MPRDAPVTIATLPERSNMPRLNAKRFVQRDEILWPREVRDDRFFVDLLNEPAQDRAGAHLNIVGDAFRGKPADDLLPTDRGGHLPDERVDRGGRIALRFGVDIRDHGHPRTLHGQPSQFRLEPRFGWLE